MELSQKERRNIAITIAERRIVMWDSMIEMMELVMQHIVEIAILCFEFIGQKGSGITCAESRK